jgi:hypothetical protein
LKILYLIGLKGWILNVGCSTVTFDLLCLILLSCPNNMLGHAVAHSIEALRYKPEGHGFVS